MGCGRLIGTLGLLLVIVSGLAAQQAAGPERWEEAIRQFEEMDQRAMPPKDAILFVGSSSIRLWDTKASFPDWKTINRGFGGSQFSDVLHYFDRIVVRYHPRTIVIYSGDNDIAAGKSPEQVANDVRELLDRIAKHLPDTDVVLLPIKPSNARWEKWPAMRDVNQHMQQFAATRDRVHYADTAGTLLTTDGKPDPQAFVEDQLHLSAEGYRRWNEVVVELIRANKLDVPAP